MLLDMKMEKENSELNINSENDNYSESENSEEDEYEANIEFSNACRNYYLSRLEATESFKNDMKKTDAEKNDTAPGQRKRSTIDDKMEKLRKEMASLMDQDVSLMKQLLTLNETINEIKQGRLASSSKGSVSSRGFVSGSDWSVASEMSISPDDHVSSKLSGLLSKSNNASRTKNKVDTLEKVNNKNVDDNICPSDLWKVRNQISMTSNDSGYIEDASALLQTEV